jgi:2-polyprenyl-3-methyl-5-hydroxy-6-metoxy-1,4-benzoquinol methylase/glycosyltransferase involved in cell wall biosynthesis
MERLHTGESCYSDIEYSIHVARYLPVRELVRGKTVLDACCGEGYASYLMAAEWGAKSVVGVDISDYAIEAARQQFGSDRVSFIEASIEDYVEAAIAKGQKFDVIVSVETLEHVDDPAGVIAKLSQLLVERGVFYLTLPNDSFYYGAGERSLNKYHKHNFDFASAKQVTERILGAGVWGLGTVANGFSTVGYDQIVEETNLVSGIKSSPFLTSIVPVNAVNALSPRTALYYAGLFGGPFPKPFPTTAALFPAGSDYRIPKLEIMNKVAPADGRLLQLGMVADVRGWAFDNISKNLKEILRERIQIDILYLADQTMPELFHEILFKSRFDHIHFLWREPLLGVFFADGKYLYDIVNYVAKQESVEPEDGLELFRRRLGEVTITFGVYDHLALTDDEVRTRQAAVAFLDGYAVSSGKLAKIWTEKYRRPPTAETPDGVNRKLFCPMNRERFSAHDRPLVIGWVGNSEWNKQNGKDLKGVASILNPAIDRLTGEGFLIERRFADRKERWRPYEEMPSYYSEIDVLVCTSMIEGTPNPVLEAMSCGAAIVSTDVGIVPEVLGPLQKEFIVDRDVGSVADAIRKLYSDRNLISRLSEENLIQIEAWEWIDHAGKWLHLLESANAARVAGHGAMRSRYIKEIADRVRLENENTRLEEVKNELNLFPRVMIELSETRRILIERQTRLNLTEFRASAGERRPFRKLTRVLFPRVSPGESRGDSEFELVAKSGYLDPQWYRETYPDVAGAKIDPARHYIENGARELRSPGPCFDTGYYLRSNPDVAASNVNPLVHYLRHGAAEGRAPLPPLEAVGFATARPEGRTDLIDAANPGSSRDAEEVPGQRTSSDDDRRADRSSTACAPYPRGLKSALHTLQPHCRPAGPLLEEAAIWPSAAGGLNAPAPRSPRQNGESEYEAELRQRLEWFRSTHIPWLKTELNLSGARVLEVGAGAGVSTVALLETGVAHVDAVDIDSAALRLAENRLASHGLTGAKFHCLNATEIGRFADQSYDMVLFFATLEHMTHQERLLTMPLVWNSLLRSGRLLCVLDTPNRLWLHDHHTSLLPFYHWLPDDVAIDYARYSPRERFRDDFVTRGDDDAVRLARWGRGVSYHDFELWFGPLDGTASVSGMDEYYRSINPAWSESWGSTRDGRFYNFLRETVPHVPAPFFGPGLNLVMRKP